MTLLITYLVIAIGISFLCSILEAVLLSITPSYVEKVSTARPRAGALLSRVKYRLDESLSSILILNTFAHTMGAAGVGAQALQVFGEKPFSADSASMNRSIHFLITSPAWAHVQAAPLF